MGEPGAACGGCGGATGEEEEGNARWEEKCVVDGEALEEAESAAGMEILLLPLPLYPSGEAEGEWEAWLLLGEGCDSALTSKAEVEAGNEEGGGGIGREEAAAAARRRAEAAEEAAAAAAAAEKSDEEAFPAEGGRGREGRGRGAGARTDAGMADGKMGAAETAGPEGVVVVAAVSVAPPPSPPRAPSLTLAEAATAAACCGP